MVDCKTSNLATIYWLYCFCVQQETKISDVCMHKYAKQHIDDVYETECKVSDVCVCTSMQNNT